MGRRRQVRQRGQALLIVLAFVAAFLLIIWAALSLASGALLGLGSVKSDTKDTYALDAGLAFAIETNDTAAKGSGCRTTNGSFPLSYGSTTLTVNVATTPTAGCKTSKPSYQVAVSSPSFTRTLSAQISLPNAGNNATWSVDWEAYQ